MKEGVPSTQVRRQKFDQLAGWKALAENPAWKDSLLTKLKRYLDIETQAAEDTRATPQLRAEHLYSMLILRELVAMPEFEAARLEKFLADWPMS